MPENTLAGMFPLVPSSPFQRLRTDWRVVLERHMGRRGLSKRALSLKAGLNETAVSEWLRATGNKKPKMPSFDALAKVALALEVSLDEFTSVDEGGGGTLNSVVSDSVKVIGSVQAGAWQEPTMLTVEEDVTVPYIPNPKYSGLKQFAWRVVGPSLNRIAKDGDYIIGVSIVELGYQPPENAVVICVRHRHDLCEYTAKRIHYTPHGTELRPDSDNPRFQESTWMTRIADEGDFVEITHMIIGVYRELI